MKQVKNPEPRNTVLPSEANKHKYYAFSVNPHKPDNKGFVASMGFGDGPYKAYAVKNCTYGNYFIDHEGEKELSTALNRMAENSNFKVYEFDTPQEMFAWLAE